jgi:hypothetical protein
MKPIAATLSNFRPVSTRKVVQLILEIPIERATEALMALGGVPDPSNPQWVGVVALTEEPVEEDAIKLFPRIDRSTPLEPPQEPQPRRFQDLPLSQQAALRIKSEAFRRFLSEKFNLPRGVDESDADMLIKNICDVTSKADIKSGSYGAHEWSKLDAQFREWMREPVL